MRLVPLFENQDDPWFNHAAAQRAYEWALEHPAEASIVAKSLAFDDLVTLVDRNREPIQKMIDGWVGKRAEILKAHLKRRIITKALNGEEVDHLVAAGEEIAKAFPIDSAERDRRQRQAERQWRGPGGRFRTMTVKIARTEDEGAAVNRPLPGAMAQRLNIPKSENLVGEQRAKFQNAWLQVSDALKTVRGLDPGDVTVAYKYRDKDGLKASPDIKVGEKPDLDPLRFADGQELDEVEIIVDPTLSAAGASFDLLAGITGVTTAGAVQQAGRNFGAQEGFPSFANDWNQSLANQEIGTRQEDFQRIGAASRLIQTTLGDQIGPAGRVATAFGNWVGTHGSEAEKVLGPGTRKLSYRYRGVEKRPDPGLQQDLDRAMKEIPAELVRAGAKEIPARNAARDFLIYGPQSTFGTFDARAMRGRGKDEVRESPLITRMAQLLPSMELSRLQLESGHVPPSHGIIINRGGVITTQAVGYGDDWYLPFNLRTIGQVNGGEYIRTRTLGGPTSEDIYTSLVTEARAFTIVSRSGVFTMEFEKDFRGTRRFNDKAKRMVDRYEKLLDAVKSQQVTPLIPRDRMAELEQKVVSDGYSDPADAQAALSRLIAKEKQSPTMSENAVIAARDEWLSSWYGPTFIDPTGKGLDLEGLKRNYVTKRTAEMAKQKGRPAPAAEFDWDAAAADLASDQRSGQSFATASTALDGGTPSIRELRARRLREIDEAREGLNQVKQGLDRKQMYQVAGDAVRQDMSREQMENIAAAEFDADPIKALGRYDDKIEERWNNALTGIRYNYARDNAAMTLDAQGYFNAMKALQEQFPYYIKRVEYRALPGQESYTGATDSGYVMPRFNRPAAAKAGYYDTEILGQGKVEANRTGYQNYRMRGERRGRADSTPETGIRFSSTGSTTDRPKTLRERMERAQKASKRNEDAWKLYEHLVAPNTHWVHNEQFEGANKTVPVSLNANTADGWADVFKQMGVAEPGLLFGDLSSLKNVVPDYQGPTDRARLSANRGRAAENLRGPLRRDEFLELMETVPGVRLALTDLAADLNNIYRSQASPDRKTIDQNLLSAVLREDGGDQSLPLWEGDKVPEEAINKPGTMFNFPGEAYKPNRPEKVYAEEAGSIVPRTLRRAQMFALEGKIPADPLTQMKPGELDDVIRSAFNNPGGNDTDRSLFLKDLYRLRRLMYLWESAGGVRPVPPAVEVVSNTPATSSRPALT